MLNGETRVRNGHDSHVRGGQGLSVSEASAKGASVHSRLGILVFSRRRKLLHMNSRALELTGQLHHAEIGPDNKICSAPVRELGAQIQETLDHRRAANIWECFELKRVIVEAGRKILVRGFGLADRNSFEDSRIVIVLEEMSHQQEHKTQRCAVSSESAQRPSSSGVFDGCKSGASEPSPALDRMRGGRVSERTLR